jgi:hypothetical protein
MYVVGVQPTDIGVSDGVGALRNQATPGIAATPAGVENLSSVAVRKVLG